ncbi:hypothetical protein PIB30_029250 [Stylosanthes scabra]|uniref:Uncharacterized protein n=1 Tax=Stylosanthes scabra TaxID=79078 RepID=A0ABU6TCB1_9FABA|nr:hypothetical protein [Stylosanthes scabra]
MHIMQKDMIQNLEPFHLEPFDPTLLLHPIKQIHSFIRPAPLSETRNHHVPRCDVSSRHFIKHLLGSIKNATFSIHIKQSGDQQHISIKPKTQNLRIYLGTFINRVYSLKSQKN